MCLHVITSRHYLVTCYWSIGIPIKLHPFTILKMVLVYDRVCQVKTQFTLWVWLQVPKYTKCLLMVPNVWHIKVTWQKWRLQKNVNGTIYTVKQICPMSCWKLCTPYTFNSGDDSNYGEYLLENLVTCFDDIFIPSLVRLSSTLDTFAFTYWSDKIAQKILPHSNGILESVAPRYMSGSTNIYLWY